MLLALILLYRIGWRVTAGRRLPPAEPGLLHALATLVQFALYALLIATVALGVANVWVRGDTLFNLVTVPAFDPGNKALKSDVEDLHALLANIVLIVAGVHTAAALFHRYVWKDDVMRRMLPGR